MTQSAGKSKRRLYLLKVKAAARSLHAPDIAGRSQKGLAPEHAVRALDRI